ncbi:glutamate-5-semialdehyde dehydrogenase [Chitinophaga skermanii]|uniref:Gamma-glutamyl phosphate reductase n=1 Tax=Chitinophaga skermanii TaxID=331697 RepID=A0A327QSU3_9BACT|nr:glutamate-5-semialdehyde dehydrogenase [Chitinophaga skermanii]RAJ06473.1 glutamate-5-semialdehyde dehydrogenase [Chitinophaga skermanii]
MSYQAYFDRAVAASRSIVQIPTQQVDQILRDVADALEANTASILAANEKDLARMDAHDPKYDRLTLTAGRIADIAKDTRNVAGLPSPLGQEIDHRELPNGLNISRIRVPLGVTGIIYEARPNVTIDVFALCFKTGNVAILKGGSDAADSNTAIIAVIQGVLARHGVDTNIVQLLPPEREATAALLAATGYVDVLIPRGSQQLINYVRDNSKVPVIETGAGIVHTYFDETGDLAKGSNIILNAKTRRVSVCNALDCLLIHQSRLGDLPTLLQPLAEKSVLLYADKESLASLEGHYPAELLKAANPEHFGTEFLSLTLAVKTVPSFPAALEHIAQHSSKHSEAIITEDKAHQATFLHQVDAAAVYVNVSTAFTDGAQFGLGAEIGISTQKLHARGPMGLAELTSYKWLIQGDGQVRS